jgi:inositol hexakisphosphate/diphosphoinositol-pentakisphosphate kinase
MIPFDALSSRADIRWTMRRFFELFAKYDGFKDGHVKLKKPKQLQEILDIARSLLVEIEQHKADTEIEEKKGKLEQLKGVLEM